jgi:hypothetical protein
LHCHFGDSAAYGANDALRQATEEEQGDVEPILRGEFAAEPMGELENPCQPMDLCGGAGVGDKREEETIRPRNHCCQRHSRLTPIPEQITNILGCKA